MEQIKDLYKSKQTYENWISKAKQRGVEGLNKRNENLLLKFINDMNLGLNIGRGSKKGSRSFIRLNALRIRLVFIFRKLQERKIGDIRNVKPEQLHQLFNDMRMGVIKTNQGTAYKSTADYVKIFKSFWHWHQKTSKEKIEDVCLDLSTEREKAKFVYFTEKDFEQLVKKVSYDLKPVLALAFDSGARVTELANIKVSDFSNDYKELQIREETSKTFGRKIKLMLCSEQIKSYVKKLGLELNDFLIQKSPVMINKELRKLGQKVLMPEQTKFKNLTLYDFRHCSCCYWLPKYKSESALKYRFGWKKSDMIYYYSEFLGMTDTIKQDDMYDDVAKTDLEKQVKYLDEKLNQSFQQTKKVLEWIESLQKKGIIKEGVLLA